MAKTSTVAPNPEHAARQQILDMQRDDHLRRIVAAQMREEWANHPCTVDLLEGAEFECESMRNNISADVLTGEKIPSSADLNKARGQYEGAIALISKLRAAQTATSAAVRDAIQAEKNEQSEGEIFYRAPEWGNTEEGWLRQAARFARENGEAATI